MLNIDKRWLGLGIILVVIAFFIGSKFESYRYQSHIQESIDLLSENPQKESVTEPEIKQIQVHVAGEVVYPGVYVLEEDARVHDAIDKAGGLLPTAQSKNLNLAARLRDGETLYIPAPGEAVSLATPGSGGSSSQAGSRVNINNATVEELERNLSGIGPALAQRIVDYRTKQGYFKKIEDIKNVSGIGEKKFEAIKDQIDV